MFFETSNLKMFEYEKNILIIFWGLDLKQRRYLFFLSLILTLSLFIYMGCKEEESSPKEIGGLIYTSTNYPSTNNLNNTFVNNTTSSFFVFTAPILDKTGPEYEGDYVLVYNTSGDANGSKEQIGLSKIPIDDNPIEKNRELPFESYIVDDIIPLDFGGNKPVEPNKIISRSGTTSCPVGGTATFWAVDYSTYQYYEATATKTYEGEHCMVFSEDLDKLNSSKSLSIGSEFDNIIHSLVIENFASPPDVDNNNKTILLYHDMKSWSVGGYFNPSDLYYSSNSNKADMIYLNIKYLNYGISYGTIAHEYQHLCNYNQNVFIEKGSNMDTWIDEGLAEAANDMYQKRKGNGSLLSRIYYFNDDSSTSIRNGHSLCIWGDNGDTLPNYSMSYIFFQYLRIHSNNKEGIFKEILNHARSDYKAVEEIAVKNLGISDFDELLLNWRLANYYNNETSIYGYGEEQSSYKTEIHRPSQNVMQIGPGGAIYLDIDTTSITPAVTGSNILFTGFSRLHDNSY